MTSKQKKEKTGDKLAVNASFAQLLKVVAKAKPAKRTQEPKQPKG